MHKSIDTNFRHIQRRISIIFSLVFLIIIVIYSSIILQAHNQAKHSFENNVRRELDPDSPSKPFRIDPACIIPTGPYDRDDPPEPPTNDFTALINKNFQMYNRHLFRHVLLSDALLWFTVSLGGYFLIGWLLKPARDAALTQETFLANASHELKTPITTIKTELSLLNNQKLSRDIRDSLDTIANENNALQSMVEKLLLAVTHDHVPTNIRPITLATICQESGDRFAKTYLDKKLQFKCQVNSHLTITADQNKFVQLLDLLLDNAGKYANTGTTIYIKSQVKDKYIILDIINQGLGIAESDQDKIWDRFYRVTNKSVQAQSGSGLGLAIARELAADLHATLTLHDGSPAHTTFRLQFTTK